MSDCLITESSLYHDVLYVNNYNQDQGLLYRRINIYENNFYFNSTNHEYDSFQTNNAMWPDIHPLVDHEGYENFRLRRYDINYINNNDILYQPLSTAEGLLVRENSNDLPVFLDGILFSNPAFYNDDFLLDATMSGQNYQGPISTAYPLNYLGSSEMSIADSRTRNYLNSDISSVIFDYSFLSTVPFEGAHGIVWKVEVNGYDAQDAYALLDPLGVGTHEFKVYFNREMDTSVDPQISYGVTMPYNPENHI